MFDHFPFRVESENVDAGILVISGPSLMAVENDVVPFCKRPFNLNMLPWILRSHTLEVIDKCLLAVANLRIVLDVFGTGVVFDRFGWAALVEHHVVEGNGVCFVPFQVISHFDSPDTVVSGAE